MMPIDHKITGIHLGPKPHDFAEFMQQWKQHFETRMLTMLMPYFDHIPVQLKDAMCYALTTPGKRLRAYLVEQVAAICNRKNPLHHDQVNSLAAAVAIELIHNYSLVHDDLPAMDNDDWRRGMPTVHRQFNEATAILVGGALHSMAYELLSEYGDEIDVKELIHHLARACGPSGLVGGQFDDLFQIDPNTEQLISRHQRKTGMLFQAAVHMALVLCPNQSHTVSDHLLAFADHFGLAYQIYNDWLDVYGNDNILGKPHGQDQRQGKTNFATLLGDASCRVMLTQHIQAAEIALQQTNLATENLSDLIHWAINVDEMRAI